MKLIDLLYNDILISAFIAWAVAQVLKTIIFAVQNGRLDWDRLFGDGGMPSAHSALVVAAATTCALNFGLASPEFGISAVLALVVLHDASGVRLESGKQAKAINTMIEVLKKSSNVDNIQYLKELLGHTPIQVFFGSLLGIAIAVLYSL